MTWVHVASSIYPQMGGNPVDLAIWLGRPSRFKSIFDTLPETNIFAPENGWLEDYFPFGKAYFQGWTVGFREGNPCILKGCFWICWNHVCYLHIYLYVYSPFLNQTLWGRSIVNSIIGFHDYFTKIFTIFAAQTTRHGVWKKTNLPLHHRSLT